MLVILSQTPHLLVEMVRLIYFLTLVTFVCFHFIRAEKNSLEVEASENEVVIWPGNDQIKDSLHQRFARQATTKKVTTKKGTTKKGTTKKGTTKKANLVAVI